jgi:hypothetical protein
LKGGDVTALVWDQAGERIFQSGIDHGVLYLHDGRVVVWNGISGVEESPNVELKSFYQDGLKYLDNLAPGDFVGKLKAYTYPDEFDSVNGLVDVAAGLAFYDQPSKSFNLSYRTRIGNDLEGEAAGYKIHILYNVIATPEGSGFETVDDSGVQPIEFGWTLTGTPPRIEKFRPTVHISIDSRTTPFKILATVERTLYGTRKISPSLPSIQALATMFGGDVG